MKRLPLLVVLLARTGAADAPGATPTDPSPTDPYVACLDQRHAIYAIGTATTDPEVRGRILARMPVCRPGMTGVGYAPTAIGDVERIVVEAKAAEHARQLRYSVTFEPFAVRRNTYVLGFEVAPLPRLGVTVHGGIGRTEHVAVGDTYHWYYMDEKGEAKLVDFTELRVGATIRYYVLAPMEGLHVGANITYQYYGDPPDSVVNPWNNVQGLGLAALAGWKGVTKEGLTMEIQAGPMLLGTKTLTDYMPDASWSFDSSVHWFMRFGGGWTF
jgi:hypothetical protein